MWEGLGVASSLISCSPHAAVCVCKKRRDSERELKAKCKRERTCVCYRLPNKLQPGLHFMACVIKYLKCFV